MTDMAWRGVGFDEFARMMRRERVDKMTMEVSRLEEEIDEADAVAGESAGGGAAGKESVRGGRCPLWGQNDPKKALEQSVVSWENDAEVARCPYCQQDFSAIFVSDGIIAGHVGKLSVGIRQRDARQCSR